MEGVQISILVVDDDPTCLKVVSRYLQRMKHHVVAMENPIDALHILRRNYEAFHLILTDVHMPEMSGLELLRHVEEEFQLPVVLMSADGDKDMMKKGLLHGASFYLVKPITEDKLQKLWQFAISRMRSRSVDLSSITTSPRATSSTFGPLMHDNTDYNVGTLLTGIDNGRGNTTISHYPSLIRANTKGVNDNANKKSRLIWTTSLHNKFLEAVYSIGLDKVVPKKILEYMNVPGLRRENVASHLQKYRIFLKKISESSSFTKDGIPYNSNERPLRSSFVLNEIAYLTNNFNRQCQDFRPNEVKGPSNVIESHGDINPIYKKRTDNEFEETIVHANKRATHSIDDVMNYVGQSFKSYDQQVPTRVNIEGTSSYDGISCDSISKNFQPTPNNYIELQNNTNEELIGTLIDSTMGINHGPEISGKSAIIGNTSKTDFAQETNDTTCYNKYYHNASHGLVKIDNVSFRERPDTRSRGLDANSCKSNFHQPTGQETLFGSHQEITTNHEMNDHTKGVVSDIQFDLEQEMFDTNFGYESFHNGEGSFDGLDQGLFFSDDDDISFENYYAQAQALGPQSNDKFHQGDNFGYPN